MCRKERITQRLYGLAQTSPCIFKHAAAVVRGSTIMSTGVNNNNRTTTFLKMNTRTYNAKLNWICIHMYLFRESHGDNVIVTWMVPE